MKHILFLGAGAFGFAMMKQVDTEKAHIYAYDIDPTIVHSLQKNGSHPYFFPGVTLSHITVVTTIQELLPMIDIIVIALPVQYIQGVIQDIHPYVKQEVVFLNLSKGIDTNNRQSVSHLIHDIMGATSYTYAMLSGGMIAEDIIAGSPVGATLATPDKHVGDLLLDIFQSPQLAITLTEEVVAVELVSSLKNIMAIVIGYYQGQGCSGSSIARYMVACCQEMQDILILLTGKQYDIGSYAFIGDINATCMGRSRNREFGEMIGKGISPEQALETLKAQKKYVEGYYTLQAVYALVKEESGYLLTKHIYGVVYHQE